MFDEDRDSAIFDYFSDLAVWKRGKQRAPNKPLTVLYALGRLEQGDRWISFREADENVRRLLIEFGPSRQRHHPEYPFWRLKNDGSEDSKIWTLSHDEVLERRASNNDPKKSELKRYNVQAGFSDWVWTAFQENPQLRRSVAQMLLDDFFAETLHQDIIEAIGLEPQPVFYTSRRRSRDPSFRQDVLAAYGHRCAVCGFDLSLNSAPIGLEAAHIQWHQYEGPDKVENGVAMCALHHKMFDRGVIHINKDMKLIVAHDVKGSPPHTTRLSNRSGRRIHTPSQAANEPDYQYLSWHRQEVFRDNASTGQVSP